MKRPPGYKQPGNWARLKGYILRDNPPCYLKYAGCLSQATTVDHIVPVAQGGTHKLDNLAPACAPCHDTKSEAERRAGYAARQAARGRRRPAEAHPNSG